MDLLKDNIKKIYIRYLIPCLGSALVVCIYTITDAVVVGQGVGAQALAAFNVLTPMLCIIFASGILCGVGCSVHVNVQKGMGENKKASEFFTASLILAVIISITIVVVYKIFLTDILMLMGATKQLLTYAHSYMDIYVWFAPAALLSEYLSIAVRGDGAAKRAVAGVAAGGIINVILDIVMVYPMKMGIAGASLASGIGMSIQLIIIGSYLFSKNNSSLHLVRVHGLIAKLGKTIAGGISAFINEFANGFITMIFNLQILKYCGVDELAVYGVIVSYVILFNALFTGMGQTIQPIMSYNYGAGRQDRIRKTAQYGYITAIALGVVATVCGLLFPETLCGFFIKMNDELNVIAGNTLRYYFIMFFMAGINIITIYYLQSVLEEKKALLLSLLRNVAFSGILLMVIPHIFGGRSLWYISSIVEIITLFVSLFMLLLMSKKRQRTEG